jgi:glutamine amidotransferase
VHLKDDDVSVDLSELNGPQDRLAIVVTEPLTTNEDWVAMAPGELRVFIEGSTSSDGTASPAKLAAVALT